MKNVLLILFFLSLRIPLLGYHSPQEYNNQIEQNWGKEPAKACKLAEEGKKNYPNDAEILGRLGYCRKILQKGDYGLSFLEKAYKMNPSHPLIKIWIEDAYLAYGWKNYSDPELCAKLWKRALEINPDNKQYFYEIGYLYSNSKTPQKAIEWLNQAIEKGLEDDNVYTARGNAYKNTGQDELALKDLEKSLALNPDNEWTLYILAHLYIHLNNKEKTIETFERFLKKKDSGFVKQQEIQASEWISSLYSSLGLFSKAQIPLKILLKKFPSHSQSSTWAEKIFFLSDKNMTVSYTIHSKKDLFSQNKLKIILPIETNYQEHLKIKFAPLPLQQKFIYEWGNKYAILRYNQMPLQIKVSLKMRIKNKSNLEGGFVYKNMNDPHLIHLEKATDSNLVYDPQDAYLKELIQHIIKNETDPYKKAELIYNWSIKNFKYRVVFYDTIQKYLKAKEAECGGYASVFVALARTAGIPARRVFSPLLEYPDPKTFGSHETSEFYVEKKGWIPVNNTANIFGMTSNVISLWRAIPDEINKDFHCPSLKDITVSYNKMNKRIVLKGR